MSSDGRRARLRAAHLAARRARDRRLSGAFATVLAAFDNAEAVAVEPTDPAAERAPTVGGTEADRRGLSEQEEHDLVQREIADLRAAAADAQGRGDDAECGELTRLADAITEVVGG